MYRYLKIDNFRVFHDISLELRPITLISGENNSGKTTILESIFLIHEYANPDVFLKLLGLRGLRMVSISPQIIWEPLFHGMNVETALNISMGDRFSLCIEKNNRYILPSNVPNGLNAILGNTSLNYALSCTASLDEKSFSGDYILGNKVAMIGRKDANQPFSPIVAQYMGPNIPFDDVSIAGWFGKVELSGKKQNLIDCLKILDENITDVSTIMVDRVVQLYITKKDNTKMPLYVMGDGIRKIMNIALAMLANPNSILLIDEVENGLHYSLHSKFWELMATLAIREHCQIIATTHSYECICGALEGVKHKGLHDVFAYIRLDFEDGCIKPKEFTSKMLDLAISSELEVR
jgi:ABC-type Mn2+/Zn2+ transport system ATPase subunit